MDMMKASMPSGCALRPRAFANIFGRGNKEEGVRDGAALDYDGGRHARRRTLTQETYREILNTRKTRTRRTTRKMALPLPSLSLRRRLK